MNDLRCKLVNWETKINMRCLPSPLLFSRVLEVLAMAIREEREIKGIYIEKEVKLSLFSDNMI